MSPTRAKGNFGLETLGIPGMNGGRNFSSDPRYAGLPAITPSAAAWGGRDTIGTVIRGTPSTATSAPTRLRAT